MPNRRDFLTTVAGATAGMWVMGKAFAQAQREVTVGGLPARVIDIHAHCQWPEVGDLVKGTKFARNIPRSQLLGADRIAEMDRRGIDMQVLSVNQFWWYAADRDLAGKIVRTNDEQLSAWCKAHPDRFAAVSSCSVQFPELAAEQLEYAVTKLGLRGASVGGHCEGQALSDPRFDPFWAKAEALGVPVFMHPGGAENVVKEHGLDGRGDLGNVIGNPLETTMFLSQMIFDGALDRFPRLQIIAAHGGGYLPSYLGRTEVACDVRANAHCANKKHPSEYLRSQILADSMVFSEEGLRHLVAEMGADRIVYGSDLPFNWPDTIDIIANSPSLSDPQKIEILGGNLTRLLKLS